MKSSPMCISLVDGNIQSYEKQFLVLARKRPLFEAEKRRFMTNLNLQMIISRFIVFIDEV